MDSKTSLTSSLFVLSSFFILFNSSPSMADWHIETVDMGQSSDVGAYNSIALDSSDNPHISYYDTNGLLKYAYHNGVAWYRNWIDGHADRCVGQYTSIALDSDDRPHISYYDDELGDLKYTKCFRANCWDANNWVPQFVDSSNNVGMYSALALDSNDNPHISYYDADQGNLKYAYFDGTWHISTMDTEGDVGQDTSIALDSNDNAHISYTRNDNGVLSLRYLYLQHSPPYASRETIQVSGWGPSIAIDSNDNPHISYMTGMGTHYAHFDGSEWHIEKVGGTSGYLSSIALDSNDNPHIVCNDGNRRYYHYDGTWHAEYLVVEAGIYHSIVLDSHDNPHISYNDQLNGNLRYAVLDSDGDSVPDSLDNCPSVNNMNQSNQDSDSYGDACDNCWYTSNQQQADSNGNCPSMPYVSDPKCGDACELIPTTIPATTTTTSIQSTSSSTSINPATTTELFSTTTTTDCLLYIDVSPLQGGTTNPEPGSTFIQGCSPATVEAIPNRWYAFSHWIGDARGSDNPITIEFESEPVKLIVAVFVLNPCPIKRLYGEGSKETELLGSFRDNVLSVSPEGRTLIKLYYQWSPFLVKALEADEAFQDDMKEMIDEMLPMIEEVMK